MNKVCVTFPVGCPRAEMDAAMLVEYFKMNRWVFTSKLQEADLILISTCAVDNSNETVSMNFLSIAKKKMRNDAKLIAFGCLPGIKEHIVNDCGMLGITRSNFSRLDSIIKAVVPIEQIDSTQRCKSNLRYADSNFSLFDTFLANFQKGSFFFLKCLLALIRGKRNGAPSSQYKNIFDIRIASGCSGLCTYCAIKKAAGPLISEDVDKIIMAFRYGLAQGFKTFRIIAEDVGAYGQDKDTSVVELLRGIFSKKEDFQLLIDDFSPKWLVTYFTELLEVFSHNIDRIGYLGFPLQSGSEKILEMMKREYTVEDLKNCLLTLQKVCPDLNLFTHILIGFPGEEDQDFNDTLGILKEIGFRNVLLYKYSDRPDTEASGLYPKVSEAVKARRIWKTVLLTKGRSVV